MTTTVEQIDAIKTKERAVEEWASQHVKDIIDARLFGWPTAIVSLVMQAYHRGAMDAIDHIQAHAKTS